MSAEVAERGLAMSQVLTLKKHEHVHNILVGIISVLCKNALQDRGPGGYVR